MTSCRPGQTSCFRLHLNACQPRPLYWFLSLSPGLSKRTVHQNLSELQSTHGWRLPWDQYVCWWLDGHLGSVKHHGHLCLCFAVSTFYLFKKTLRAEWQGHKRSSRLTFRGAGKLFFLLVTPLCISSNNVWGLQYSNVLSDACPSLPFQIPL